MALENPQLPSKFDGFDYLIKSIQHKAAEIVKLQEIAKKNGELTESEQDEYREHMKSINESSKSLAEAQESASLTFETREGLSEWFDMKREKTKDKNKKKDSKDKDKKKEEESKKEEQEKVEEEEENVDQDNEGVAINLPPADASVAEAKPVGLAVAGEGGVAASKPIATAVVGPGGLAIARPVGTAIAGVSPDQALVPIYAEGSSGSHKKGPKNKSDQMSEFLNKIISKYHQT
ncbi:unnamed protein product [Ceutorhynchus assimilis]|uniref:DUF4774 domain-containing protein n=1 Tax=Ceutorhynchus assimilis TaxID=467358 RepID=A0A9P0DEX8_9CUCU|nr:unnamed protein product [Ceutorhynchus assimilis]